MSSDVIKITLVRRHVEGYERYEGRKGVEYGRDEQQQRQPLLVPLHLEHVQQRFEHHRETQQRDFPLKFINLLIKRKLVKVLKKLKFMICIFVLVFCLIFCYFSKIKLGRFCHSETADDSLQVLNLYLFSSDFDVVIT